VVGVRSGESMRRHPQLAMEMLQKLGEWTSEGKLIPHVEHVYSKDQFKESFEVLAHRQVIGKAVVPWVKQPSKL